MTVPKPFDERQARKQFVRRRQKLVFTITVVILAVAMVFSLLFTLGDLGKSVKQSVASKPNYGVAVPCAPANSTYVNHPNVTVRVLNGTDKSGLGTAIMEALSNDGFSTQTAGDFPSSTEFTRTEIRFGKNGIANAYTVATEFNDAILRMDDRSDKLVDVIVGSTFNNLKKTTTKTASGQKITSIEGCVTDPSTMKNLPKASSHTAVN
ncbi:MAG: LytR C-terminal domain-containing protein [Bifidobacterium sp.]|uniref:LytR C-terminal domain-containing protein n=1 Tax=Bifidobacterium fermentum TaxID=3059035 RepID=A0AB39ULF0_9BIFI